MTLLLLAFLALLPKPPAPNSTPFSTGTPPARFMGPAKATVRLGAPIDQSCGAAPEGRVRLACTHIESGSATITAPNPCSFPGERFAQILCHEIGHVNGWPDTHGD